VRKREEREKRGGDNEEQAILMEVDCKALE